MGKTGIAILLLVLLTITCLAASFGVQGAAIAASQLNIVIGQVGTIFFAGVTVLLSALIIAGVVCVAWGRTMKDAKALPQQITILTIDSALPDGSHSLPLQLLQGILPELPDGENEHDRAIGLEDLMEKSGE